LLASIQSPQIAEPTSFACGTSATNERFGSLIFENASRSPRQKFERHAWKNMS
jgi:hypothetical protein